MSNDPSKRLPLSQQLSGLFRGFSSKLLQKKTIPTKVTVCDLGRMQTVLLELEKDLTTFLSIASILLRMLPRIRNLHWFSSRFWTEKNSEKMEFVWLSRGMES